MKVHKGACKAQCDLGGCHGDYCPHDLVTDKQMKLDGWISAH